MATPRSSFPCRSATEFDIAHAEVRTTGAGRGKQTTFFFNFMQITRRHAHTLTIRTMESFVTAFVSNTIPAAGISRYAAMASFLDKGTGILDCDKSTRVVMTVLGVVKPADRETFTFTKGSTYTRPIVATTALLTASVVMGRSHVRNHVATFVDTAGIEEVADL